MRLLWTFAALALSTASLIAEGVPAEVTSSLARLDSDAAKLAPAMRIRIQLDAAQTLAERFPELAHKYAAAVLAELKSQPQMDSDPSLLFALASVAPQETIALLPRMKPGADSVLVSALVRADRLDLASSLYISTLDKGPVHPSSAVTLLSRLAKDNPAQAAKVFSAMVAKVDWSVLAPMDAYYMVACAYAAQTAAPELAALTYEKVALTAAPSTYGADAQLTAGFQVGKSTVSAANARDAVLIVAGARLHDADPKRFGQHKELFSRWEFGGGFTVRSLSARSGPVATPDANTSQTSAIQKAMGTMRGLPTDADRAELVLKLIGQIRLLPAAATRVSLAGSLSNLATEGDLGVKSLTAIVDTMGQAMRDAGNASLSQYTQLATLMRYEHIPAPIDDPALTAAGDLLVLREAIHQGMGFTLTALDGKTYSLSALKGQVVLLNFWATWCPPCRKEMPDMEKLYSEFSKRGFVVLAVSDEERDTVVGYISKQSYTFPILLDAGREVNKAYGVEGIPKSFLFDRDGKIVAQAIDMRTERQFRELLKTAGLE